MKSARRVAGFGVLLLVAAATVAPGDIIHLKAGKVEGIILKRTETELVVETTAGKVTLNPADVVKIERKPSPLELYREMARDVKPDDAEGHYRLGMWCIDSKLFREAGNEFRRAVAVQPDHKGAHERLGHVLRDGKWLTRPEARRAEGLVRHEGRWVTEDERDNDKRRQVVVAWRKRLQRAVSKKPAREEDVAARIAKLLGDKQSDVADIALRSVLRDMTNEAKEEKRDRAYEARVALVEAVGDQKGAKATELLRWTAIADPDDTVRSVAVKALRAQKSLDNTAYFVGLLRQFSGSRYRIRGDKKSRSLARRVLRRGAQALGDLEDPRAVPALANVMVVLFYIAEQQKDELPPMNVGFSSTNFVGSTVITDEHGNQFVVPVTEGNDWNMADDEPKKKVESGFFFNDPAYNALRRLTRQDFGHDKRKWLAWWYRNRHDILE